MNFLKLSYNQLQKDCIKLYERDLTSLKIDLIISITRGANTISHIYSDLMGLIPITHITISSYKGTQKLRKPIITEAPARLVEGKIILIVDDVSDTGATFELARNFFRSKNPNKIFTLSPYIKPHTTFIPDFWIKKTSDWIIFPYDIRDSFESFLKIAGNKKSAIERMKKVGFKKHELECVQV